LLTSAERNEVLCAVAFERVSTRAPCAPLHPLCALFD